MVNQTDQQIDVLLLSLSDLLATLLFSVESILEERDLPLQVRVSTILHVKSCFDLDKSVQVHEVIELKSTVFVCFKLAVLLNELTENLIGPKLELFNLITLRPSWINNSVHVGPVLR